MLRWTLYILTALIVLLAGIAAAHPWILAGILPPIAKRFGVEISDVKAQGYSRIYIEGISGTIEGTSFRVDDVTLFSPVAWLLNAGKPETLEAPLVDVSGVDVVVALKDEEEPEEEDKKGPLDVFETLETATQHLRRWLPWAELKDARIEIEQNEIVIQQAVLRDGTLTSQLYLPATESPVNLAVELPSKVEVTAQNLPYAETVSARAELKVEDEMLRADATVSTPLGQLTLEALLGNEDWIPDRAVVVAPDIAVPGELFNQPELGMIQGDLRAAWEDGKWGIEIHAEGRTELSGETVPLTVNVSAVGTTTTATIGEMTVLAPQGKLKLLQPVALTVEPPFLRNRQAAIEIEVDPHKLGLADLPSPISGHFDVRLTEDDGGTEPPTLVFTGQTSSVGQLQGRDLILSLDGRLAWPLLQLQRLTVDLGSGSMLAAMGNFQIEEQRVLGAEAAIQLGPEWISPYLPEGAQLQGMKGNVSVRGPLDELAYSGTVMLENAAWRNTTAEQVEIFVQGVGLDQIRGSAVALDRGVEEAAIEWRIQGGLPKPGEALSLSAEVEAAAVLEQGTLWVTTDLLTSGAGIQIQRINVFARGEDAIQARGFVPLSLINSGSGWQMKIDRNEPVSFTLDAELRDRVRALVEELVPIQLGSLSAGIALEGPIDSLRGTFALSMGSLQLPEVQPGISPLIEDLEIKATATERELTLEHLRLAIDGQPLQIDAHLPAPEGWVEMVGTDPMEVLSQASANLVSKNYPLSILSQLMPEMFAETGTLDAELGLRPGLRLTGDLVVTNVRTRPAGTGATLTINRAALDLTDRRIQVADFDAVLGRRPLEVTGFVDLTQIMDPAAELRVRGERLPMILSEGLILRGDADILFKKEAGKPALISGTVQPKEGLILQDLQGLASGGGPAGAPVRPPYFSVEGDPVGTWMLDLRIKGDRFLRIETPVFSGRISADFRLTGQLQDPLLVGEAEVNSGLIRFPFATLRIDGGRAYITRQDPHSLQLDIQADGGAAGYSIVMNVDGTSDNPELTFTSTPPLQQEEILLLVTAGTLPEQNGLGRNQAQQLALYLGQGLFRDLMGPGSGEGIGDKLTVDSGREISEQGRETYSIEYEINKTFSLEGGYDVYDQYNIGVRWNVYSR